MFKTRPRAIGTLAALLALCTAGAAILFFAFGHHHLDRHAWNLLAALGSFAGVFGTVTITNLYPFTTTPTVAQMQGTNPTSLIIVTVAATAASDTSASITHNFGLAPSEISQGFPFVTPMPLADPEISSGWWVVSQNPNFTVLQKNTTAAAALAQFAINRPHSYFR